MLQCADESVTGYEPTVGERMKMPGRQLYFPLDFDPDDVDSVLEDIILGEDSIEHQPGLKDFFFSSYLF